MHTRDVAIERVVSQELVTQDPIDLRGCAQGLFPSRLGGGHFTLEARERLARLTELTIELGDPSLLLRRGSRDKRRRVYVLEALPALGDVVEEREDLVELQLRDRIELVVVAARAPQRQAEPDGGRRRDSIDRVFHQELRWHDPAFGVQAVVAVETGGDTLVQCCVGEHVTGDLLDRELIERHVVVVGIDHPVPPAPHAALAVGLVPVRVGIPGGVQPLHGHPLTVSGRLEQPVDHRLVRTGRVVAEEGVDLGHRRRQSGKVQGHTANQRRTVRLGRGAQAFSLEPRENEVVDRVAHPIPARDRRERRTHRRDERPMTVPLRSLIDPPSDRLDLVVGEGLAIPGHAVPLDFSRDSLV